MHRPGFEPTSFGLKLDVPPTRPTRFVLCVRKPRQWFESMTGTRWLTKCILFQWVRWRAALPRAAGPGTERVRRGRAAVSGSAPASAGDSRHACYSRHRRRLAARGTHLWGRWIHEHERKKVSHPVRSALLPTITCAWGHTMVLEHLRKKVRPSLIPVDNALRNLVAPVYVIYFMTL